MGDEPHIWVLLVKFVLVVMMGQLQENGLLAQPLLFALHNVVKQLGDLLEDDLGAQGRQQLNKIAQIVVVPESVALPELQMLINGIEAVLGVYFIVDGEAPILVAHPLLVFGIHEYLEHIDKEAGVHDGRIVRELLLVNWGQCPGFLFAGPAPCFRAGLALHYHQYIAIKIPIYGHLLSISQLYNIILVTLYGTYIIIQVTHYQSQAYNTKMPTRTLTVLLGFLGYIHCLFQATSLSSSVSNNYTLVDNVLYDLNFSLSSQSITAGSTLGLKFSQRYFINSSSLTGCKASTSSATAPSTVPCSVLYYSGSQLYQITMTGVFGSTTTYSFIRLNFQISNPYAEVSQPINLTIYTLGSMIGYGTAYISTYKASPMTGCSVLSASMLTGANATHTYTFTPPQRLIVNSYLLVQMPIWYGTTGNEATSFLICTGLQGTDLTSLSCTMQTPITTQTLNLTTGLVSSNRSSSTIKLSIADLRNPWSLEPFGPINLQLMYGSYLTQVCYGVYNSVTTPNTLGTFIFNIANLNISTPNTGVRIAFLTNNPFPRPGNRIMLQFSSEVTVAYSGTPTVYSQNSTQITLSGLTSFSVSGFTVTTPPSTRSFVFKLTTFQISTTNSNAYATETRSLSYNCVAGAISGASASATNAQVNAITTYTITFTIRNRLQATSFINVVFPSQLSIQTGSASCSMSTHTCTVRSAANVSVVVGSAITANSVLTITVVSVKNSNQALTTSSFAIYTYYDSLYDSLVDKIESGIAVTMTPRTITTGLVTPSSLTTFSIGSYKIDLTLMDYIPAGGYILVVFPATVVPQSAQLIAASFAISSCSVNLASNSINITNCFATDQTNLALSLNLSNIRNPPSFKPSETFKLYTRGPSGSLINFIDSGLTVTMNIAASTTGFTVAPLSPTVGASTSYTFQVVHTVSPQSVSNYCIINIPALMALPSTPSCTAVTGLTSVSCVAVTATQLKVVYTSTPATTVQFSVAGVINYLVGDQPVNYGLAVFDSGDFKMEEFLAQSVTYAQSILSTVAVNNDSNIALGQRSNITLTVSNSLSLYPSLTASLTQLDITIPPQFTIGTTCSATSGACTAITASKYRVTSVGLTLSLVNITMSNVLLSYFNPTSTSFGLVYTYNGFNVSYKTTGVVVSIFCTSPCQRCSTSTTTCESCLPAPNTLIYHDSQTKRCAAACVSGKYPDANNECKPCVSPCATCLDATNCTSCVASMWLYQTTCMAICPSLYYNNSNGNCTLCQSPCRQCTSLTSCINCATGYFTSNWCVAANACPTGTYANSTTMACELCSVPCSTCSLSQTNCTACQTGYLYYSNLCVQNCPSGMYQSSIYCFNCVAPCATCISSSACLSCATGFLNTVTKTCVNSTNCPSGTYANTTTQVCQSCSPPCQTCSTSQTNCTACQTGFLYYSNLCVQNCPSGMYQSSIYCFTCVAPCATCATASACLSCSTGYLNTVTKTCVDPTSCPAGTYPNATSMQCMTCPTGCTACTNSTNCSSCNSAIYVFYNFNCLTSCPAGTYQSGIICLSCAAPCSTCRGTDTNCTSCILPKLYYNTGCVDVCPDRTYNNNGTCASCLAACSTCSTGSTCDTCVSPLYFQNSQCVSQCSSGTYANTATSTCVSCIAPCSACVGTGSNCTQCISPQVEYQNGCLNSCPATYFAVSGSCKTCPNCLNCLDASTCLSCKPGYYEYNGLCYTACPTAAPIPDDSTNTCGKCDVTCRTCQNTAKNCTNCYSVSYLYKGSCLTQCPQGFIEDQVSGTCKQPLIGNIIYFPFSFFFLFFFIVCIASKCLYPQTENITTLGAIVSLSQFGSWCVLSYIVTVDYNLEDSLINAVKYVGLVCILLSVGVGVAFIIAVSKLYEFDKGILAWKQFQPSNVYSYRGVNILSCLSFRFFRFLYSRFFNRTFFTMYVADGERFITTTNRLTFVTLFTNSLPMVGVCAFVLYKKQIYDQSFFCALDTLILGFISGVVLTIDSCKNKDHFDSIKEGLPFLKYKNMGNDDSLISQALLSRNLQDRDPAKSEVDNKQKDSIFKKITWLPNLNRFGHLNVLEDTPNDTDQVRSLPEHNKLGQFAQYDPNRMSEGDDRVVDDDLYFLREEEERRKRQQAEQEERKQQERRRLKKLQEEEEQRKRQEQARRKRQLMEEDQRQRVQLKFPDLAAIDKVENKNGKNRKNPLDLLSNCKKVEQKPVDDKALKKLQQIGKKNGIDPTFMKETFGVEKNHNPELLNKIIDKHNHVKRESIKQLFSENNNPELLQQLFSKNSKMDPKKLSQILNDPDSAVLIRKLADKQEGIISPEMAKQLFQQNSKYTKQFTKNLLSDDNGMDPQKLKALLKDSKATGKDSPLKALKKIGGQNLQNTKLLANMLGEDSTLNPQNFTRVANDLSIKAIENLFTNKTKNNDIIAEKILNNKKINLKNLTPILEDEELLQELAEALGSGDPHLQENLINLFKNAQNIDPAKLKQMLADPIIRQKLLTKPIDPQFLATILNKDSKSDLKILSNALKQMPDELIQQTFKFDPQRNTDFKNLAELFDANPKTDPTLVAKMLDPDMVKRLYVKGNGTKMLNKLVEKGNQFDPEVIKNVYGQQRNNIFDTKTDNMHNNLVNFDDDKGQQFRSQKQYSLGFQKNNKNQVNMSRTAGGVLSFLTPIVPISNKNMMSKQKREKGFNESNQDGWTSQGQYESAQEDDDGQIQQEDELEENGKKRKKKVIKRTKKKLVDIRHPAQQIYLQRIQAPHEHAVRKASIRKKKKKVQNPGVMDEDNDIFDMDF